mmetsp:Transcript_301/g.567  ORF Transcript_301/g.567 Transcript_301/m.567 type:complete len:242 (+) Transcript_301:1944-2669(+)
MRTRGTRATRLVVAISPVPPVRRVFAADCSSGSLCSKTSSHSHPILRLSTSRQRPDPCKRNRLAGSTRSAPLFSVCRWGAASSCRPRRTRTFHRKSATRPEIRTLQRSPSREVAESLESDFPRRHCYTQGSTSPMLRTTKEKRGRRSRSSGRSGTCTRTGSAGAGTSSLPLSRCTLRRLMQFWPQRRSRLLLRLGFRLRRCCPNCRSRSQCCYHPPPHLPRRSRPPGRAFSAVSAAGTAVR